MADSSSRHRAPADRVERQTQGVKGLYYIVGREPVLVEC